MLNPTSLVINNPSKILGLPESYYRCRTCDTNLNSNTPATRYQIQKRIQNTVRVPSSLYMANIAPMNAYAKPTSKTYNVCWNQMSDRPEPSYQPTTVPSGFHHSINNKRFSVTSSKPGSQTPGGYGVDIKHNSYDRYLNRLKGKGPLRRGVIPKAFAAPEIKFNRAYPIYGSKLVKTSIVTGCNCPVENRKPEDDLYAYNNPLYQELEKIDESILIGRPLYVLSNNKYVKGKIQSINGINVIVLLENGSLNEYTWDQLKLFSTCEQSNCDKFLKTDDLDRIKAFLTSDPSTLDYSDIL